MITLDRAYLIGFGLEALIYGKHNPQNGVSGPGADA